LDVKLGIHIFWEGKLLKFLGTKIILNMTKI